MTLSLTHLIKWAWFMLSSMGGFSTKHLLFCYFFFAEFIVATTRTIVRMGAMKPIAPASIARMTNFGAMTIGASRPASFATISINAQMGSMSSTVA